MPCRSSRRVVWFLLLCAFDVLGCRYGKSLPGFPIVLHGSSSVPQEEVDTINKYGGELEAAIGIPEEELRKAAKVGRL